MHGTICMYTGYLKMHIKLLKHTKYVHTCHTLSGYFQNQFMSCTGKHAMKKNVSRAYNKYYSSIL